MTADLGPAATPRPIPTPGDRMTAARQPGPTFATYLDRHDRDQLDARAATAEQERDDALDDLDAYKEARDVAQQLATFRQGVIDRHRQELGAAGEVIAVVRDAVERIDRALAVYDTTPGETCSPPCTLPKGHPWECDPNQQPHEDPSRLREQLAEAHADCARYATERDEARRLLNQTTAALNVALHHANDNTSYSPTTDHYKQRADELDGCRIALQEATEATSATPPPGLGSPCRAQGDIRPAAWEQQATDAITDAWTHVEDDAAITAQRLAEIAVRAVIDAGLAGDGGRCRKCGSGFPRTLPAGQDPLCWSCGSEEQVGLDEPADRAQEPRPGQFCTKHFSWLCQAGQGRCQGKREG